MNKWNEKNIQEAAYYLWQNAGCPNGQNDYFWTQAMEQFSSCKCNKNSSTKKASCCKSSTAKKSSCSKKSASSKSSSCSKKSAK